jgi:hypothetical protein
VLSLSFPSAPNHEIKQYVPRCAYGGRGPASECICVVSNRAGAAPFDEARSASSLNSALRPRESGFAKIG